MKTQLYSIIGVIFAFAASSATATTFQQNTGTPFSQYGQIQNVQNYSSNPFWDPSSPYNQRMPVPVYIQGTDISSTDCQTVVSALISSYCSTRNNCYNVDVNEARPTLTVQLASLPNHNYVTPCAGYIDTEFEKYVSQNALAVPTGQAVAFPTATASNPNYDAQKVEFQNPYQPQLPTWNGDPWAQEMLERKQELENLQSANSTNNGSKLAAADFPKTASDLTFIQRIQNDAAGYAPYEGKSAFVPINIESDEQYLQRMQQMVQNGQPLSKMDPDTYCENARKTLAILESDLQVLKSCQETKKKISDCIGDLKSDYFSTSPELPLSYDETSQDYSYTSQSTLANTSIGTGILMSLMSTATWWTLLFSDSDCIEDPITKTKACCNVAFEKVGPTDKNVKIGGYMFCGAEIRDGNGNVTGYKPAYGFVRQCLQGRKKQSTTEAPWYSSGFRNDFWSQQCMPRFCEGEVAPLSGLENILEWTPDTNNICWTWNCPTGYKKIGNNCIPQATIPQNSTDDNVNYEYWIKLLSDDIAKINSECPKKR